MNKALRILLLTNGCVRLAEAMLGPIYALFVEEIGGDLLTASFAFGLYSLVSGVTVYFLGNWEDAVKEQELAVVFGYLIIAFGFAGYLFVHSPQALLIVQIIIGFGDAVYSPAFDAVYSKHLHDKKAAFAWGSYESMTYILTGIGAVVGGLLVTLFGFNAIFICMSALCLFSSFYIYILPRRTL